ncbi:MAG: hypothetical protein A4S09_08280 [Proteobacteria bacterium SG_bin7]|nr:MAG: hypothetical protein A4S09_08280 [Proteobacteria bacterium SG_bin7]
MNKIILTLILFAQIAMAAEFECKSGIAAVVAVSPPDFDQFIIKGELSKNFEIKNVSIRFNSLPLREAYFERLQPLLSDFISYNFFDGQDYRYQLNFPQKINKSFKAHIVLSQESYISTEALECSANLD